MKHSKALYIVIILLIGVFSLTFRPGLWLVHKPASTQNESYARGWEDGCISGTNTYSLLYAPMLDKPFIKEVEGAAKPDDKPSPAKEMYRTGWNEGFTLCRFYQASVYELMQFAIIVVTLLFIGYQLARKRTN